MPRCKHFLEIDPAWKHNCGNCARWNPDIGRCSKEDEFFRNKG